MNILRIDGSIGEGGGQVLRYALALSSLTLKPIEVYNIRAKRSNPGLRPQHLTAVQALAELTNAELENAYVGSTSIKYKPSNWLCRDFTFDIGTAGSISLVIQAMLPVLVFNKCRQRIVIKGGTNVPLSPPIDYMIHVFSYNIRELGVEIDIKLRRRGHYPRGGGLVELYTKPIEEPIKPIEKIKFGKPRKAHIISHSVKLPQHVARRQADSALHLLRRFINIDVSTEIETYPPERDPHLGPGSGILVYIDADNDTRIGGDSVGEKGKPAEVVGEEAVKILIEDYETGMAYDRHMSDMLIPYLFLAKGTSVVGVAKVTLHTITAIEVAKIFIPEVLVKVEGGLDNPGVINITGIGFYP